MEDSGSAAAVDALVEVRGGSGGVFMTRARCAHTEIEGAGMEEEQPVRVGARGKDVQVCGLPE